MPPTTRLIGADEYFHHQTVEPVATPSTPDLSWGERKLASLWAKDGSLEIILGLAQYSNRNVFEGFAGASRRQEQWTVRGSRRADADFETLGVGPMTQETIDPLRTVRYSLAPNEVIPLSFDVTCGALLPAFLERRELRIGSFGARVATDLQRWHQMLTVSGRIELDGEEIEIDPAEWIGFRCHSWGTRPAIGQEPPDLHLPAKAPGNWFIFYGTFYLQRPDGSDYELFVVEERQNDETVWLCALHSEPDGAQTEFSAVRYELRFDPANRRLLGGSFSLDAGWGEVRTVEMTSLGDTGFHVGTGRYGGFQGQNQGAWMGPDYLDGEYYADCTSRKTAEEIHPQRDTLVEVREGEAVGQGVLEVVALGGFPQYSLSEESSFY